MKDAFASVLKAEVMRSKVLDEARSYENQVTNKASADAESIINLAQSDRARLVSDVAAQAQRFQEILPQYQRHPALFDAAAPDRDPGPGADQCAGQDLPGRQRRWKAEGIAAIVKS